MSSTSVDVSPSDISSDDHSSEVVPVEATYSKLTDRIRRAASGSLSCRLFCGGARCKYESAEKWTAEEQAIPGLYSHWVTESILAMARPSTVQIQQERLMEKFERAGITSVFNVQQRGEHPHCGPGLDPSSGFTYPTELFMERKIFFYNFEWEDFHAPDLSQLLDVVKVMSFAVTQGKAAVHCHAGLGRTGVLIACFLVFKERMNPFTAIRHVREKRPGSIQTSVQVEVVKAFSEYLQPLWIIFPSSDSDDRFTFENHLANQKQLSHGIEYSQCKHVPKIVAVLCHQLSELFGAQSTDACTLQEVATWCEEQDCTPSSEVGGCRSFGEYHCREPKNEMHQHSPHHIEGPQVSASASHFSAEIGELGRSHKGAPHDLYWSGSPPGLCGQYGHEGQSYDSWGVIVLRAKQVKHLKEVANSQSDWSSITSETDPCVLLQLLVDWFWTLKEPVLSTALWRGREAAVYLGTGVGTGSVTKGTAEEKTIHCLKQMIDKIQQEGLKKKMAAIVSQSLYQGIPV